MMQKYFFCLKERDDTLLGKLTDVSESMGKTLTREIVFLDYQGIRTEMDAYSDGKGAKYGPPVYSVGLVIVSFEGKPKSKLPQLGLDVPKPNLTFGKISSSEETRLTEAFGRACSRIDKIRKKIYDQYSTSPFLLPFRNFDCPVFQSELDRVSEHWMDDHFVLANKTEVKSFDLFLDDVDKQLRKLRHPARIRKKGKKSGGFAPTKRSFIDQRGRSFAFANNDLHGGDPRLNDGHVLECMINGYFRLGCRINSAHHFDVVRVKDGLLIGEPLYSCHSAHKTNCAGNRSNMWTNDHHIDKR